MRGTRSVAAGRRVPRSVSVTARVALSLRPSSATAISASTMHSTEKSGNEIWAYDTQSDVTECALCTREAAVVHAWAG